MKPRFFATPGKFRQWLEKHHTSKKELLVGFYKRASGEPSMTWPESVDEALSFGWIDGIRRSIDAISYSIRFTPRSARSKWSAVNLKRVAELTAEGRMRPAGVAAYERRDASIPGYSYERRNAVLDPAMEKQFRSNRKAWTFWSAQPPYYHRLLSWWVISAKKEETRQKRLAQLIAASAEERRIV